MGRRRAHRVNVVVTGGAAAGYPDVIEHRAAPAERRMAGIALQVGDDVRGPLALCLHAVVAGRAAAAHLGVVEVDRRGQAMDVWQLAHWSVERMWLAGLAVARTAVPMP